MKEQGEITILLDQLGAGNEEALDQLVPLLYDDLRRVAHQQLRFERTDHTITPTALVNEAYLKLIKQRKIEAGQRTQFLMIAGHTMRRVLVDYARKHKREKRGGGVKPVPMEEVAPFLSDQEVEEVLGLDQALKQLEKIDKRGSKVIECRFYCGLSLDETAKLLNVSVKTVQRDWLAARAWLRKKVAIDLQS